MKFEIYKDKNGEWRWRIKAANGKIIADSSEGYKNKQDAINMINAIVAIKEYNEI
jgi:uncharacterized protein YegP (UPF0339 family)